MTVERMVAPVGNELGRAVLGASLDSPLGGAGPTAVTIR